jgi:hypothetical protein
MTHQPELSEAGIDRMKASLEQQRGLQSEISRTYFLHCSPMPFTGWVLTKRH